MQYDKELVAGKLRRWESFLDQYRLPAWEAIPDIGLYMEQVIALLKDYLDYLPPELKQERFITAAAINNYVRKKIIPEPRKKKYYRVHIAYLIILCSLKRSLSIPTISAMLSVDLTEEALRKTYNAYVRRHAVATRYFAEQVKTAAAGILDYGAPSEISTDSPEDLITFAAVVCGFSGLLAEKLLLLEGRTMENGGSVALFENESDFE